MSADILGTSWDQCRSMVQYSFTSTKTRRLVRTDSPGQPPRLSHSSWTIWNNLEDGARCTLYLYWKRSRLLSSRFSSRFGLLTYLGDAQDSCFRSENSESTGYRAAGWECDARVAPAAAAEAGDTCCLHPACRNSWPCRLLEGYWWASRCLHPLSSCSTYTHHIPVDLIYANTRWVPAVHKAVYLLSYTSSVLPSAYTLSLHACTILVLPARHLGSNRCSDHKQQEASER